MLPNWLIKKIEKNKAKDNFIQEQLYIEEYAVIPKTEPIDKKEEIEQRGVYIIDLY